MEGFACMQCNRTKLYLAHPSGPFQSVTDRQVSSKTALRAYALMLFTVSVGGGSQCCGEMSEEKCGWCHCWAVSRVESPDETDEISVPTL